MTRNQRNPMPLTPPLLCLSCIRQQSRDGNYAYYLASFTHAILFNRMMHECIKSMRKHGFLPCQIITLAKVQYLLHISNRCQLGCSCIPYLTMITKLLLLPITIVLLQTISAHVLAKLQALSVNYLPQKKLFSFIAYQINVTSLVIISNHDANRY